MRINIKYHNRAYFNKLELKKINKGDWIDLYCAKTTRLIRGEYTQIPLGVSMELPKGYEAYVLPRSSTYQKYGILMTNGMGVIDNSYCGDDDEWKFPALAVRDTTITRGERIAQFRIVKNQPNIKFVSRETLGNINRGGFGSTGRWI